MPIQENLEKFWKYSEHVSVQTTCKIVNTSRIKPVFVKIKKQTKNKKT